MNEEEAKPSSPVAVNDGADDVVEADVAASDAHHTHLVEGDFFPTEAPEVVEADVDGGGGKSSNSSGNNNNEDEEEANVEAIAAEAAAAVAASLPSTPPKAAAVPSRKRVRWADGGNAEKAHGLVKHVTSFYMPHSSRGSRLDMSDPSSPTRPTHAAAVNPTPSVFRNKVGADGSVYKFCKAQRPALRFVEWKRQPHEYGATPFEVQPRAAPATSATSAATASEAVKAASEAPGALVRTLFGALYQRSVVTRVAEGQVRIRYGKHHRGHADSLQLPFTRPDQLYDEPFAIPLPP